MILTEIIKEAETKNPKYDFHKLLTGLFNTYKQNEYPALSKIVVMEIEGAFTDMKRLGFSHECIKHYVREYINIKYPRK